MTVIHINGTTQQYIADNFNEGVVPQLEQEDTYYLVTDGEDNPNLIVSSEDYCDNYADPSNKVINIIKK
jgi:hypothetical protein